MSEEIIVVGAGGFGREVIDVIHAINAAAPAPIWSLQGVVDDSPSEANLDRLSERSLDYLGTVKEVKAGTDRPLFVIGIGNPAVRKSVAATFETARFRAATLVHPSATLGSQVTLGPGTIVCAGARITTNVIVGQHVHVNLNATIGHDSRIGDYASINPLASISGDCVVGDGVLVGVSASLINGVAIGNVSVIGGGACAVRDVPAATTVVGVPARPLAQKRSS